MEKKYVNAKKLLNVLVAPNNFLSRANIFVT